MASDVPSLIAWVKTARIASSGAAGGWVSTTLPGNERLACMMQQPDGKVVIAGYNEDTLILIRYGISTIPGNTDVQKPEILMFPNPVSDQVVISGMPENTLVSIYNLTGQKMFQAIVNGTAALDMSTFHREYISCTPLTAVQKL